MRMKIFACVIVSILALNTGMCAANTESLLDVEISEHEIFVRNDVVFARYDTWPQSVLKMDIYSPSDNEKHPALIFIPGGCWIAVMGASAGGYLAVMLGVTGKTEKFNFGDNLNYSSEVQAVIDFFGVTDLTKAAEGYSDEKKALYYSASSFFSIFANGVAGYKDRRGGSVLDT